MMLFYYVETENEIFNYIETFNTSPLKRLNIVTSFGFSLEKKNNFQKTFVRYLVSLNFHIINDYATFKLFD